MRAGRRAARARIRRIVAVAAGIGLVVAGVGVTALNEQSAKAAQAASVLQDFDPANIIDDAVMFNGATMTAGEIQTFLNDKQPTCTSGATCLKTVTVDMPAIAANPMCSAIAPQKSVTAAKVIAAVGKACSVSPQVILVMLQKEQTLVTGRRPGSSESVALIYRKATGLGCPDTAACDPSKYGLFNQLYGVAYWLVRYTTPPGTTGPGWTNYNWFPVGKGNGVLYSPRGAVCGAKTITIANKATASLYYYTPYQPNASALAAGWGLGDSCGAYGNRNFYLYFTTWFGSTHTVVTGAIKTFWTAHKSTYGNPTTNAVTTTANGGGTYQRFQKGTITTSPAGSFGVAGSVLTKYTALGGPAGALGWPKKAVAVTKGTAGGSTQEFQKGIVYVSTAGAAAVLAPIAAKYATSGGRTGSLGWPTADATTSTAAGGATWQAFQGGRVVVAGGKSTLVVGAQLTIWVKRLAELGSMGWPTADKKTITAHGKKGVIQTFQTGIATTQGTTRTVTGAMGANYVAHGGPTGYLGWPTAASSKSTANGGGWSQRFAGGALFWSAATKAHGLGSGKVLALYDARGGVAGSLGWLQSSGKDTAGIGGTTAVFTSGRIYSSKVGTVAVRGDILARYLAKGGTKSVLGWPTSNARSAAGGATVQTFEHGKITYTAAGGAVASRAASGS